MPVTAVSLVECNYPVVFDTYRGCAHNCKYCFTNFRAGGRHTGAENVSRGESLQALEKWCRGERNLRNSWCDWDIPLAFGRNSDPFQPIERKTRKSLAALKILAKHGYPFILTTKGVFPAFDPEYLAVLKDCNVVWQQTMCSPKYDALEPNAPPYEKRLEALHVLSGVVPRTIARSQPMFLELFPSHLPEVRRIKEAGAYGVLTETAQLLKPRGGCAVRDGRLYQYPPEEKERYYARLRRECHRNGLKFLCCDFKHMSDSLLCCGTEGLDGFVPNYCNASWYLLDPDRFTVRPNMRKPGTGEVFQNFYTGRMSYSTIRQSTFEAMMKSFIHKTLAKARSVGNQF